MGIQPAILYTLLLASPEEALRTADIEKPDSAQVDVVAEGLHKDLLEVGFTTRPLPPGSLFGIEQDLNIRIPDEAWFMKVALGTDFRTLQDKNSKNDSTSDENSDDGPASKTAK
jgi:hypothetical protein